MSRIRTVKPEFWSSEQILNLSIEARLFFIGMWNFCDDNGVHTASLRTIKAEVFPGDDIDVEPLVQELLRQKLIDSFLDGEKSYWYVTGWKHQKIDKPTYKYPPPPGKALQTKKENNNRPPCTADNQDTDLFRRRPVD